MTVVNKTWPTKALVFPQFGTTEWSHTKITVGEAQTLPVSFWCGSTTFGLLSSTSGLQYCSEIRGRGGG